MSSIPHSILAIGETLESRWHHYRMAGDFESFVEYSLSLDGLLDDLQQLQLPGLARSCQELEALALPLFGDASAHPIPAKAMAELEAKLHVLLVELRRRETPAVSAKRASDANPEPAPAVWSKPRDVLIVRREDHPWGIALQQQLGSFGFRSAMTTWESPSLPSVQPLAVVFIPDQAGFFPDAAIEIISSLRRSLQSSRLCALGVPTTLESIISLQRAGIDSCIPNDGHMVGDVLSQILETIHSFEQDQPKVLIVEDSKTAALHIRRSLAQYGIDSLAIASPSIFLETLTSYHPDLVLMDMYMPICTGVEATRAMRQIPEFQVLPVVYLSSETDVAQQVEALRLGGDQFLTKPVNPVMLASVVKTKIERYRDMLRLSRHDSLTGLLNHSAGKQRVDRLIRSAGKSGKLAVAMIDIDRFKSINDNYGHPVGDQVIRGLAWLLGARLRACDLVCRYGGEEFLVALPGASLEEATKVIDNVREAFGSLAHAHAKGVLHSSLSAGVAALPHFVVGSALIKAADDALLTAKRSGRNCVIAARDDDVAASVPL